MDYTRLTLENWGPFLGKQEIDLSRDGKRNVVIIYGENGTGKSHIFRALQFALYGQVIEDADELPLSSLTNEIEARERRQFATSVALSIEDSSRFTVQRSLNVESLDGIVRIASESASLLLQDSAPLSGAVMRDYIEKRFPRAVSKFFLFDAELIRRFQSEIHARQGAGLLRKNIHEILGVPAFTNVSLALERIETSATKRLASIKTASNKADKQWKEISEKREQIQQVGKEIDELEQHESTLEREIRGLSSELTKYVEQERALGQKDIAESEIKKKKEDREELLEQLKGLTRELWFAPLVDRIENIVDELVEEEEAAIARGIESLMPLAVARLREKSEQSGQCQLCGADWSSAHQSGHEGDESLDLSTGHLFEVRDAIRRFDFVMREAGRVHRIRDVVADISKMDLDIIALGNQIERFDLEIGERGDQISVLNDTRDSKVTEKEATSSALDMARKYKASLEGEVKSLRQKIGEAPTTGLDESRELMARGLGELFDNAVSDFENEMRLRVEEESSRVFSKLISSNELTSLSIDDEFRVTARDADGSVAPRLSQGQEQVQAISLLAGLFECGVRNAPLVMDTPFARLDSTHISNILEWITLLDRQVVLLVQSNEFNIQRHRPLLEDVIAREYRLEPIRLKETQIRPGRPDLD